MQEIWFYKVYEKRNPTLILYNLDKTNFYSFILALLFSLIFCLFAKFRNNVETSIDRFVSHLNMFINCPNVLLEVSFVQSLVCCNLTLKYVTRFQSIFTELNLLTGQSAH